jgi:glycine cleavage system aminomethyltransferase T
MPPAQDEHEEVSERTSPLYDAHLALGAKMVSFGGWEMPLAYGAGTVAEHRACREDAVAFDVSHLGTVRVTGADAFEHLQVSLSNDLRRVHPGRAQYTHLLDEAAAAKASAAAAKASAAAAKASAAAAAKSRPARVSVAKASGE